MSDPRRPYVELINAQYGAKGLAESLLHRVRQGKPEGAPVVASELYPFDQVHTGGVGATRELAKMAGFGPGLRVLDVGSGLGGSARFLAAECGCRVVGIDLTASYHEAALHLTAAVGLSARVEFHLGDATALSFADGTFDGVLLQHCTMNVPDKARLFRECARVLRAAGVLALHEWVKLGEAPLILPVRWADTPDINWIVPRAELERRLEDAGFVVVEVRDVSGESQRWMEARTARAESARAQTLFTNMARNLAECRAACLMAVYEKASRQ